MVNLTLNHKGVFFSGLPSFPYLYVMKTPDFDQLTDVFSAYPDIQAVYLFGSMGEGDYTHEESDLDLAILPRTNKNLRAKKLDILTDLARYGFCNVDLVFLDTDDIILKYEAIRQNRVIYVTEDFDRGSVYSMIVRQYLDFMPYLDVQRKAYKRSIIGDQERNHSQTPEQIG